MARSDGLSAAEILAYLDSTTPPQRPAEQVRAYREAAAVLAAVRDPEHLRPVGAAPPGAATALLGPDLVPATGRKFNGTVMLRPEIRAETISDLVASGRVEDALAANPDERDSPLQAHLERYLRHEAPPLAAQSLDELEATLQVSVWLGGVVEGVPTADEVEARAGYFRLLAPFEALAGDAIFRGRKPELDRLRRHIGVVSPESALERLRAKAARWIEPERQPAISISGIGGAGKSSLVARFMLEHTRLPEEERIPFGYLDFARASLDVGDTLGLCLELLRQLNLQFPAAERTFSQLAGLIDRPDAFPGSAARDLLSDILHRLRTNLGPRPYVVVLDTFEEVQYRGEEHARPLWSMLSELQDKHSFLRVVVSGRAQVESLRLAGRPPRRIELGDLDDEAADAFLAAQGIEDPGTRDLLIESFGRLPLSLKLVGSLAARTPGGAAALLDPVTRGFSLLAASDEVVQARLYGRILDHISDERVRRLAHPGLTLRRINPALILEVLNEPCDLLISTPDEATALFEELRRESSLVSVDSADGDLVHRPDLRRVMLKMLLNGAPAVVRQIHASAAAWYSRQPGRRARAEYVYHRLHLGDYADLAADRLGRDELYDREVRASIQAVIEEFSVEVQLWLATFGFKVSDSVREQGSRDQEHASVAAQIEELLPYGARSESDAERIFELAYQNLRDDRSVVRSVLGRVDRGASPVFRAGARVAAQRGDDEQALYLIERGLERAVRDSAAELTLGLLKERAWLFRKRPRADQAEGLALLSEHARRYQDLAGQIQHRAQWIDSRDPVVGSDMQALGRLLGQASPQDLWGLVPVLRPVLDPSPFRSTRTLTEPLIGTLRNLVAEPESPFRLAVFPDSAVQSSLDDLLGSAPEADLSNFYSGFMRLCNIWPYRILYVAAPQGRRGEQLTIE